MPEIHEYLRNNIQNALSQMGDVPEEFAVEFQTPGNPDHGDLASNAAMQLAKVFRKSPRQIAEELVDRLDALPLDKRKIRSVEVAGAGFLNFWFGSEHLFEGLRQILKAADDYGKSSISQEAVEGVSSKDPSPSDHPQPKTALVEFVSANPTGPLTVGHGRNAVLGDTIANLLSWSGYDVSREYYFNDAGRQMRVLSESVRARYLARVNPEIATKTIGSDDETIVVPEPFPDDGYLGDYIDEIAAEIFTKYGKELENDVESDVFKTVAKEKIFTEIKATLERLGIRMDSYFNEKTLYDSGRIWKIVDRFKELDLAYEKDGATWFKTTEFGKEQDTVLIKSSGEPTYRLPDIGYHIDKIERGYSLMVDVFGADHIATFPDVVNGVKSLGYDPSGIDVVIYQFVTLVRGNEPVKMSTRKAQYVTLDDLIDEVSEDVTRFFFLMRSANTHLEFDLDLAREASDKNPVFYLQYAHARICSILRKAEEVGFAADKNANLDLLKHDSEIALVKVLLHFPEIISRASESREPHRVATYLREVAVQFTQFYSHCRIIGETEDLASARMLLAIASKIVLRNGLTVLGISAPDRM
ncbi:MAG: arginine--tRNA ligase [Bacteroidetes bacterium]|nr:MAG: arginine--tRNA ligase [Bacteroidota bacterium]